MVANGRPGDLVANEDDHRLQRVGPGPLGHAAPLELAGESNENHHQQNCRHQFDHHELGEFQLHGLDAIIKRFEAEMDRGDRLGTVAKLGNVPLAPQKSRQLEIVRILHVADQVLRRQRIVSMSIGVLGTMGRGKIVRF